MKRLPVRMGARAQQPQRSAATSRPTATRATSAIVIHRRTTTGRGLLTIDHRLHAPSLSSAPRGGGGDRAPIAAR